MGHGGLSFRGWDVHLVSTGTIFASRYDRTSSASAEDVSVLQYISNVLRSRNRVPRSTVAAHTASNILGESQPIWWQHSTVLVGQTIGP